MELVLVVVAPDGPLAGHARRRGALEAIARRIGKGNRPTRILLPIDGPGRIVLSPGARQRPSRRREDRRVEGRRICDGSLREPP